MSSEDLFQREGGGEEFSRDVTHLQVEGDVIWLNHLFESPVAVRATIQEADFLMHMVTLIPSGKDEGVDK